MSCKKLWPVCLWAVSVLPNPHLTPGQADPKLTKEVICSPSFRTGPYRNVPESEKKRIALSYGLDYQATRKQVEYDHLISLELGGSNEDLNIWPEFYVPIPGAHEKDKVENYLHRAVCKGNMTLENAQKQISTDWVKIYKEVVK